MGAAASVEGPVSAEDAEKMAGPNKWSRERFESIAQEGKIAVDEWNKLIEVSKKFDFYDTDSDGFLSPEELSLLLKESGYIDEEMLAKYIAKMMVDKTDDNHDGKLDFGEFIRVYRALAKNYQKGLDAIDMSSGKHAPPSGAATDAPAETEKAAAADADKKDAEAAQVKADEPTPAPGDAKGDDQTAAPASEGDAKAENKAEDKAENEAEDKAEDKAENKAEDKVDTAEQPAPTQPAEAKPAEPEAPATAAAE